MTAHRFLIRALCALVCLLGLMPAFADQAFPQHPITLVVPFPPGGTTDILARTLAERMSRDLKTPILVENRAGAGGNVGAEFVVRSKPDGHTLLLSSAGPLSINQHLYPKQGYDPLKNFAPVSLVASVPIMLVTHPSRPFTNVRELIAYAKAHPGKLSYGSQGNGTTSHLTMELLKSQAGIEINHVPYRGSATATTDLIGGQIDLMFDNSPSTLPHVQSKRLRALGIASSSRVPGLDGIPPIAETVKGFESNAWFALVAPAGTPENVIAVLNKSLNAAVSDRQIVDKMATSGVRMIGGTPRDLARYMADESKKWSAVIKRTGVTLD